MIHFHLNIEKFYESELEINSEVRAIACIEYPVIHLIAKTIESMEEKYDELDRFIVRTSYINNGYNIKQFSDMTGLGPGVFNYRVKELAKQKYVIIDKGNIKPIEKGVKFINSIAFEREIVKTRSFILDGVTHSPLRNYFYKEGSKCFISEEQKDHRGNRIINPGIIFNPPTKNIIENIFKIPLEERLLYNIPSGIKKILDYDFELLTYPILIVLSTQENGKTKKKFVDGYSHKQNSDTLAIWQNRLLKEINKTEILIEEKELNVETSKPKRVTFRSNWGNSMSGSEKHIFNITKEKLSFFVCRQFGLSSINDENIELTENQIRIKIDKPLLETEGADKKRLLESCIRKRDYYRQNEGTGVWLVFFDIVVVDDFVENLINLYTLLQSKPTLTELLTRYKDSLTQLRQSLVAMERFDILEELDIYLFLYSRNVKDKKHYLTLKNG